MTAHTVPTHPDKPLILLAWLVIIYHKVPSPPDGGRGEKPRLSQRLLIPPRNSRRNLPGVWLKVLAGIILGLAFFGSAAFADEAAKVKVPDFVPFVVDQVQDQAARSYLNGLTFKDAAPLVAWLNELEVRAKGQWEADHAVKPAEVVKP